MWRKRLFQLAAQAGDQFGGRERTGERSTLSGPLGPVSEFSGCLHTPNFM